VRANVEQIRAAARTGAGLTRQLLIFGRRDVARDEPVDLNALVEQTEGLLRRSLGERTTLRTALDCSLPPVVADRSQLEQLVLNLAINARDAMPDGGTLTIATAGVDVDGGEVAGLEAGRHVLLSVTDTGHGMEPGVVERAFEPFYSTKAVGQGTGLGLTTVYGIVTRAGGTVEIDSAPGEGTTVSVYLPAGAGAAAPAEAAPAPAAPAGPPRRIMVVEDNDTVRDATAELLRRRGHDVTAVAGGEEALDRVRAGADPEVLLSDVVMPGLTGPELAAQLRELRPGLPTVFMSGHTGDVTVTTGSAVCIAKPFDEAELLAAIERAVAAA
jgi:CheY-like chemotaxis protein